MVNGVWFTHIDTDGQQSPVEITVGSFRKGVCRVPLALNIDRVQNGLYACADKLRVFRLVLQFRQHGSTFGESVFREQPARRFDQERHHAEHCDWEDRLESNWEAPTDFVVPGNEVESEF